MCGHRWKSTTFQETSTQSSSRIGKVTADEAFITQEKVTPWPWVSNFDLSASSIKVLQSTLLSSQLLKIPIDFSHRHHHRDILGLGRVSLFCVFLTLWTMHTLLVLWLCSVPNYSYMGVKCRKISGALSKEFGKCGEWIKAINCL